MSASEVLIWISIVGLIFSGIYVILTSFLSRKIRKIPKFPAQELDTPEYTRKNLIIPLSDGTKIAVYHYFPKSESKTGITFIATHGFLNTALAADDVFLAQSLVSNGHQVISFDTRFHGNSAGKKYAHYTPSYFPAAMLDDTAEIISNIKKMPEVDSRKLGFIGFSFGGTIALSGAMRDPDITCIIAGCAIHDYNELAEVHLNQPKWMDRFATKEVFFHRQRARNFHDAFEVVSPKNYAKYANGKQIFLLHCKDDIIVPYNISLRQNQNTFGIPEENILVFEQGGHKFIRHREEVRNQILKWINVTYNTKKNKINNN